MQLFPVIQVLYWLSLSTWFGGVLFIALAAPVIFRTVREQKPMLPTVLSVNLENQHADLLAGSVVANLLSMLGQIQLFCAAGVFLALIGQWVLTYRGGSELLQLILRTTLLVGAAGLALYDRLHVWPRMNAHREDYFEHADDPDVANPAKDRFDRYQRENLTILMVTVCLLAGIVLFSGNITPAVAMTFSK